MIKDLLQSKTKSYNVVVHGRYENNAQLIS